MEYQKSGIIFYKLINGQYYFLLAKNNLNLFNENNNFYSDINGSKGINDFNSKDTASRSFYENTFGLIYSINDLKNKISDTYENKKYKYILHFINEDISLDLLSTINQVRSYLNQTFTRNESNEIRKKECTLQGCLISNSLKWFELSEILKNPDQFDKKFMNSILKSIKHIFIKKGKESPKTSFVEKTSNQDNSIIPDKSVIQAKSSNENMRETNEKMNIYI